MKKSTFFVFSAAAYCAALLLLTARSSRADTYAFAPKSDGTIARFHADTRTGQLALLPGMTDTEMRRPVTLCLSTDKRFLYAYRTFDIDKDGVLFDFLGDKAQMHTANTKPTPINVFLIEKGGGLRRVQSLTVPGPVGQMVADPKGRFVVALSSEGAFLLNCARGGLQYKKRVELNCGMSVLNGAAGSRNAWWLTFAPSGNYLYGFRGDGFVDHSENYLQRYKISPVTGQPKPDGDEWYERAGDKRSSATECGAVELMVGQTAFIVGFAPGCAVRATDKAGRIAANGSPSPLLPKNKEPYHYEQTLLRYPSRPLVVYRGGSSESYTVWRVVAPGKIVKAGGFPSAFKSGAQIVGSTERFLYEIVPPTNLVSAPFIAVYAWDAKGNRAKLSAAPASLPFGCATDLIFANAPPAPQ